MAHKVKFKTLLILSNVLTIIYLLWRIFFTLPFEYGVISCVMGVSLLLIEIMGLFESLIHFHNVELKKPYPVPEVPVSEFPDVDVFIATYNEDPQLLYKTVTGCKWMKYPDPKKVHIYLCDDNRRSEIRELAEKMGVGYFDRPDNKGAKAGNLNNALSKTDSPYVVTFDADMIPRSNFLMDTIPYFVEAEMINRYREEEDRIRLGLLQTPQAFYNPDLYQFNLYSEDRIPNEQDYFYKDIEASRTHTNSVIYGGSNTVISREALNAIGGFYTEAITEDFATGLLLEKAGYVSLGTSEQLASGLSPNSLEQLVQQRVRWARGVINTGKSMKLLTSPELSTGQKLNYLASIWYWYSPIKRLIYILAPITFSVFGYTVFKCTLPELLIFWLPMALANAYLMRSLSQNIRSVKWTSVYETAMFPFLLIPVVLETFGFSLKKFKVTEKTDARTNRGKDLIYSIPFLILLVLSGIGIWNCIWIIFDSNSMAPIIGLYWLIYNAYTLIMAFFFVDGRETDESSMRIRIDADAKMQMNGEMLDGSIYDCSETGISFFREEPIEAEETGELIFKNQEGQPVRLSVRTTDVKEVKDGWKYDFEITAFNKTYDAYLRFLFDREPVMASSIKKYSGIYDDLWLNLKNRISGRNYRRSKQPEIQVREEFVCQSESGQSSILIDSFCFAFLYARSVPGQDAFTVQIRENLQFECVPASEKVRGARVCRIQNLKQIRNDPAQAQALHDWLAECEEKRQQKLNNKIRKKKKPETIFDFDEMELV